MSTITPVRSSLGLGIEKIFWETMVTGDTIVTELPSGAGPISGSVQFTGTFNGGTTVTLTGSNDGTNYVTLKDLAGNDISFTAAGAADFTTAMAYIKPGIASGSADDVDATVVLRT